MVYEEATANLGTGVYLHAGEMALKLREPACQTAPTMNPEPVMQVMGPDGMEARIGEEDGEGRGARRVAVRAAAISSRISLNMMKLLDGVRVMVVGYSRMAALLPTSQEDDRLSRDTLAAPLETEMLGGSGLHANGSDGDAQGGGQVGAHLVTVR